MKKTSLLSFFIIGLMLAACNENRIYSEHTSIPSMQWEKGAPIVFRAKVTETDFPYKLIYHMRHTTTLGYGNFPLSITIISPDGTSTNREYTMPILDPKRKAWVGEAMGDLVDTPFTMETDHYFTKEGTYTFEVRQLTNQEPLDNVIQIGVVIEKNIGKN